MFSQSLLLAFVLGVLTNGDSFVAAQTSSPVSPSPPTSTSETVNPYLVATIIAAVVFLCLLITRAAFQLFNCSLLLEERENQGDAPTNSGARVRATPAATVPPHQHPHTHPAPPPTPRATPPPPSKSLTRLFKKSAATKTPPPAAVEMTAVPVVRRQVPVSAAVAGPSSAAVLGLDAVNVEVLP